MAQFTHLEGIVLKKRPLLGAAWSVTIFTRSHGKVQCIVKGGRSITSIRSPHLQTGNLVECDVTRHVSGAWYLTGTSLRSAFSLLKEHEGKVRVLYNILLVIDRLLPLEMPEIMTYEMLIRAIIHLDHSQVGHERLFFTFVRDMCEMLGYGEKTVETYEDVSHVVATLAEEDIRLMLSI